MAMTQPGVPADTNEYGDDEGSARRAIEKAAHNKRRGVEGSEELLGHNLRK